MTAPREIAEGYRDAASHHPLSILRAKRLEPSPGRTQPGFGLEQGPLWQWLTSPLKAPARTIAPAPRLLERGARLGEDKEMHISRARWLFEQGRLEALEEHRLQPRGTLEQLGRQPTESTIHHLREGLHHRTVELRVALASLGVALPGASEGRVEVRARIFVSPHLSSDSRGCR